MALSAMFLIPSVSVTWKKSRISSTILQRSLLHRQKQRSYWGSRSCMDLQNRWQLPWMLFPKRLRSLGTPMELICRNLPPLSYCNQACQRTLLPTVSSTEAAVTSLLFYFRQAHRSRLWPRSIGCNGSMRKHWQTPTMFT